MVSINTKYIILIWIIILILFTFYCIIRLKYLKEKYDNTYYYDDINNKPIIALINSVSEKDKITNVEIPKHCKTLYDDNIKIQYLGYNNCETAFSDYISKGFDVNNNYGQSQSLSDICPIATKSPLYIQCMTSLLNKFTNNSDMLNRITNDMSDSINKRLTYRNGVLDNVQNQLNPLIYNKEQNDFNTYMKTKGQIPKDKEDIIGLVDNYYQSKYQGGVGYTTGNIGVEVNKGSNIESFIARTSVYIEDPAIEKLFFGKFKPINGQLLALNDIELSIDYEDFRYTSLIKPTKPTTRVLNEITNILLTINSNINNMSIIYNIVTIDNYKSLPNAIKIIISSSNIISNTNDSGNSQTILQLLSTLGITAPTQLIMTYEEFKSSEGVLHKTYKLVNDNLDTIIILNKL